MRRFSRFNGLFVVTFSIGLALSGGPAVAAASSSGDDGCGPEWQPTFGARPYVGPYVETVGVLDTGNGPSLYVGGSLNSAGSAVVSGVARWDGITWSATGTFTGGGVRDFLVFDDGSGPAIYACGGFTVADGSTVNRIARLSGAQWMPVGDGFDGEVFSLTIFDDGSGPALYAGGAFTSAGSASAARVARWNGSNWTEVGSGFNATVRDLCVFDAGAGPALFATGDFTFNADETESFNRIAAWQDGTWQALGTGLNGIGQTMVVHDDGSGEALFVGGEFVVAGSMNARRVARWDGAQWSALGEGLASNIGNAAVFSLTSADDGRGPALYAGGRFLSAGGVQARRVARWDGTEWRGMGTGIDGVYFVGTEVTGIVGYETPDGPSVVVVGDFESAGPLDTQNIAMWKDGAWRLVDRGLNDEINASVVFDDGTGPAIYAGGAFNAAGDQLVHGIARWNGARWVPVGGGVNGIVHALEVFDDGTGPALYAGGEFTTAGGADAFNIARWDGATWTALGDGLMYAGGSGSGGVYTLKAITPAGEAALVAGGIFNQSGAASVSGVARWNGQSWQPFGAGLNGAVYALACFDDGQGEMLYAGGEFFASGSDPIERFARWNGESWEPISQSMNGRVLAMQVFDDGSGPALFLAGWFGSINGQTINKIARWDGEHFSPLGAGVNLAVRTLAVFDDGDGEQLYAGGTFSTAGNTTAQRLARWNGLQWSAVTGDGDSFNNEVNTLLPIDLDGFQSLFIGGRFFFSPASDSFATALRGCMPTTSPAPLTDFAITFGALLGGGLDDLRDSDDQRLHSRSGFGFSAIEPTVLELRIGAIAADLSAATIGLEIESAISQSNGVASVRLRNWMNGAFEEVHTFTVDQQERTEVIAGIDATNRIRPKDGRIELAHRIVVAATFSALGFDASHDRVAVTTHR